MPARTEDLLTIRDGEPIDAGLRDRVLADPANRRELASLAHIAEELRRLPVIAPPPGVWGRIEARAGRAHRSRHRLAAAAALLAISAGLVAVLIELRHPPETPPPAIAENTGGARAALAAGADYTPLVEESVRLERILSELQPLPRVVNAGTAVTIADLEERLVLLDDQLTFAEASNVEPRYQQALWRERVDVMNALVHVRYAQYWDRGQ